MRLNTLAAITVLGSSTLLAPVVKADAPPPPSADLAMQLYDRHKIDISNLYDFYEGLLIADAMIHDKALFDAETKWRLTLRQMIGAGSGHHTARSAYQLSLMGIPLEEIQAIFAPDFIDTLEDDRLKAAFTYIDLVSSYPSTASGDMHALLRTHYTDRQISELMQLGAVNAATATHDAVIAIVTDQETVDWATENLSAVGWSIGRNAATSPEEQRARPFVGAALAMAQQEIKSNWFPEDLGAVEPVFTTDWVNYITGYNIPRVTFDGDFDGIEQPFDAFPFDKLKWAAEGVHDANLPPRSTPAFNVSAYDYDYFDGPQEVTSDVPYSDRQQFDTQWNRAVTIGTLTMDEYILQMERTKSFKDIWSMFFVFQLASGCVHCQAHGSFGIWDYTEDDYFQDEIPVEDSPDIIAYIQSLMDFERSKYLAADQKAALRVARDSGRLPARITGAHIEELRRHFSDRGVQETLALPVHLAWLSISMQSMATVTDQLSMSWAMTNLGPMGWSPGVHTGLPIEQRPYHMSQLFDRMVADISTGKVPDAATEFIGKDVPLAVDTDGDGVEDAYDGFPRDPSRWADTDRDGTEDRRDRDIDGDGLSNRKEVEQGTFPYKADSDGDGIDDREEIRAGTDPLNPRDL
ncbi:MAG: hypothetical protein AAF225_11920 [Pseudomonadota bacterium]